MSAGHAFQRVLEIGEGLDLVELGGSDERADGCPSGAAAVGSGKQVVLAAERDRTDDALDGIGVEFEGEASAGRAEIDSKGNKRWCRYLSLCVIPIMVTSSKVANACCCVS
jgi:hypothetical protein